MTKRMMIDATHAEETRVVVLDGNRLEDFDVETSTKRQLKGNIYLAKVVRVEPSLQAAFVEYGGNRHGFLAFSEIHPDYYQIPIADRQRLLELQAEEARREEEEEDRAAEAAAAETAPSEAATDEIQEAEADAVPDAAAAPALLLEPSGWAVTAEPAEPPTVVFTATLNEEPAFVEEARPIVGEELPRMLPDAGLVEPGQEVVAPATPEPTAVAPAEGEETPAEATSDPELEREPASVVEEAGEETGAG